MYVHKPRKTEAWLRCPVCQGRGTFIVVCTVSRSGEIQETDDHFAGRCDACDAEALVTWDQVREALNQQHWDSQDRRYWA